MYYNLYIDSLFLINAVMNLYVLSLVNRLYVKTASPLRLLAGSAFGAAVYCLMFMVPVIGRVWVNMAVGFLLSGTGMIGITYQCRKPSSFFRLFGSLTGASFFLGGTLLFLWQRIPFLKNHSQSICVIAGMGAVTYMISAWMYEQKQKKENGLCRVTLEAEGKKIEITALLDTGNTLVEPISGKPVSIVTRAVLDGLFEDGMPELFRVVPYSSIGKSRGILKCYEISKMWVEYRDTIISQEHCYVAYSTEYTADKAWQMILHPGMTNKILEEKVYDIQGGNTGENPV